MHAHNTHAHPTTQRGTSLLEALLAITVLAAGALTMSKLQHHLHAHADVARQRSEAVRLAQHDIESTRAFATLQVAADATGPGNAFDGIAEATALIDQLDGTPLNAVYQLTRELDRRADGSADDSGLPRLKSTTTRVTWTARDGSAQHAALHTALAAAHPAMAGALNVAPGTSLGATGHAGVPSLPLGSVDLGQGRSAFKPTAAGTTAWLFDNASGLVVESCEVPARLATDALRPEQFTACRELSALLLGGVIRFSHARPPNALAANDAPLAVALSVALPQPVTAASPWCHAEAQKTVQFETANGTHRVAVALAAVPADVGAVDWADLGERFVAYHCLVPVTPEAPQWSGASTLVPLGWTLGTGTTDHRVCRYTAELDGNATTALNEEHPAVYRLVRRTLLQQNFLVIAGDQTCPAGAAARIDAGAVPSVSTVQHQP